MLLVLGSVWAGYTEYQCLRIKNSRSVPRISNARILVYFPIASDSSEALRHAQSRIVGNKTMVLIKGHIFSEHSL